MKAAPTAEAAVAAAPLPEGWKEAKAPDGRTYYYHSVTKERQWAHPLTGAVGAPAAPPSTNGDAGASAPAAPAAPAARPATALEDPAAFCARCAARCTAGRTAEQLASVRAHRHIAIFIVVLIIQASQKLRIAQLRPQGC